jgi:hypothetical protein
MTVESVRSRRAVLAAAAGAVAASAVGAVAASVSATGVTSPIGQAAASSDGQTIHVGDQLTNVRSTTNLKNTSNNKSVFHLYNGKAGIALHGQAENGPGVVGTNNSLDQAASEGANTVGCGVLGFSGPSRPASVPKSTGVYGRSEQTGGFGVIGEATDTGSEVYGVEGLTSGPLGRGVFGWSLSESSGGTGVWGESNSPDGVGVMGYAWHGFNQSTKYGTGVMGFSGADGLPPAGLPNTGVYGIGVGGRGGVFQGVVGVFGVGKNGRGGIFDGDKAQVRLIPSEQDSHPAKGLTGDLFVDKKYRLWFCQGGSNWVKVVG